MQIKHDKFNFWLVNNYIKRATFTSVYIIGIYGMAGLQ